MNKKYIDFVPSAKTKKTSRPAAKKRMPVVGADQRTHKSVDEVRKAKSKVVKASTVTVRKPVEKPVEKPKTTKNNTFVPPKATFINQEKVVKRPLSKNTYQKRVEEKLKNSPKEEPKGPVTIISKPEKDAKVGVVVTIIITIILGAAAGTVAFLLLPK